MLWPAAAQILKSQQSASDHVMENRADPDSQTITAFIQSVEEKLTSEHCKSVLKFRGHQPYIRQSNDLNNACDAATERAMLALVNATTGGYLSGDVLHFGGNMAQGDLGDRQPMYFDGQTVLPGRALVTQRKKDTRRLFGLEEQPIIIGSMIWYGFMVLYFRRWTDENLADSARARRRDLQRQARSDDTGRTESNPVRQLGNERERDWGDGQRIRREKGMG